MVTLRAIGSLMIEGVKRVLRMYHRFRKNDRGADRKGGRLHGKWMLAWMICLAAMLWGCGVSGGGDQITKMDEKYLAKQESQSPGPETDSSGGGGQTEAPKGEPGGSPSGDSGKPDRDISPKSTKEPAQNPVSKDQSNQNSSSPSKNQSQKKKSSASNAKSNSKNPSAKKSKTKSRKSSSTSPSPGMEREDQDASREDHSGDDGKREEEEKDGDGIHCFVSIDCKNILSNLSKLKESKKDYVPKDGVILKKTKVTVKAGTSVYDVLYQVCRERKIHLEAAYTPMYGTYYVEGIHQLYEFDCGDLSGWNYLVNGSQPNRGCSKYQVQEGDVIAWRFTCDRGKDL